MEKNYGGKKFFSLSDYNHLFQMISSSEDEFAKDDLETIDDALTQCRKYVDVVDTTEQQIMLAQVRFEGEEYREAITRYDNARRRAHESAIASANLLNRMANLYGCQKIYKGSSDRLEIADFCLEVCVTLFKERRK